MTRMQWLKRSLGLGSIKVPGGSIKVPGPLAKLALVLLLSLSVLSVSWTAAQAVPFSGDLTITGDVSFDTVNSSANGEVQSGSFGTVEGGAATVSTFNGTTVTGANPLAGVLTDIGDGFSLAATASTSQNGSEFNAFLDLGINLTNSSLTDIYEITFNVDFSNWVNASGTDAFADSEFSMSDPGGEVFFTDLISDTLFGNQFGGVSTAGFGGVVSESGLSSFVLTLGPSASVLLDGFLNLRGGVFDNASATDATFSAFVSVGGVRNLTSPPVVSVPEPATLILLASGMFGLGLFRRFR